MELQALLVLCGLGVAGIAVFLLMGLFSTSGTSYEEAMAQQRKATTELLALAESKNKSKKNNKKAIKKQAKKEKKESITAATSSEPESETLAESSVEDEATPEVTKSHVEFSPPVVVEVQRDAPPNVKIRKRGKDHKVKPILVNKEDPSCVSDPVAFAVAAHTNVTNHFEEMHPKDEFELLQATLATEKPQGRAEEAVEKKESKPAKAKGKTPAGKATSSAEPVKEETPRERHNSGEQPPKEQRKAKKVEKRQIEEVIETPREEVVPPLNAPQPSELTTEKLLKQALVATPAPVASTSTPPGGKKKKKAEPNVLTLMAGDSGGVNVNELVRVVREAALSRTEIQILTEALLNKHHDPLPEHSDWTEGPNDPMQKLKKQLADKEKALADEIDASQGFQAKLKELRANLNAERSRAASVGRASEQAAAAARAEMHTLQTRLQRLLEENHSLTQEKLMLQSKLGAEGEVQAQRVQMEMHIQRLSEAEAALLQQIAALQAECQAHALDATAARDSMMMAQQHAEAMAQQLQEANRLCAELEQQRQMALHAEQRSQQELRQLQDRLAAMAELQNEVQRLSTRAQAAENNAEKQKGENEKLKKETEKLKGDAEKSKADVEKIKAEGEKIKADLEKINANADRHIQQLTSELKSLGELLVERESQLAELEEIHMQEMPAQNGLPPNDAHKREELAAVHGMVESLRGELAAAQHGSRDQRDQLARLQAQLAQYQEKNNELRTKNWKVMEALQSAEKALQTRSATALPAQDLSEAITKARESQYAEVEVVLRAACPDAAPANAASGRDWLQAFADNLHKRDSERLVLETKNLQLEDKASQKNVEAPRADDRLNELLSEKEYLEGLVDKYKRVIDETEGVLSRLQLNVTSEEQRWAKQLSDKQQELDELRQRTVLQMQNKIDTLEAQLAKSTNHNHSFADAERSTEERLMAGLSEKLVESSNGPSQVGLQEI